jgi:hypothetical protein
MLHDWKTFGEEITTLLKTSGDSGDSGDKPKNANVSACLPVPTRVHEVSPLRTEWGQACATSGDSNSLKFQTVVECVPTVSTVPTNFERGVKPAAEASQESRSAHSKSQTLPKELPTDWRSGFAAFCVMPSPEAFPMHRWQQAVHDGFAFLTTWGMDAVRLGWRVTDLFGASLSAPWARVGMLGLIPLLNGDAVVALDADAATIEARSGARLRYRRHTANEGRVCLWEIGDVK